MASAAFTSSTEGTPFALPRGLETWIFWGNRNYAFPLAQHGDRDMTRFSPPAQHGDRGGGHLVQK